MRPRFFAPHLETDAAEVGLPPEEAHHLVRVLRLRAGDEVVVFDGRGREAIARVASVGRQSARLLIVARLPAQPPAAVALTLVQAVLKAEAMDSVVRDATMAGVEAIQPVVSRNTTVKTSLLDRAGARWRRIALASAKQCGRSRLPDIRDPVRLEAWLATADASNTFLLVEPAFSTAGVIRLRDLLQRPVPAAAALLVGPEGGWTAEEHDLALRAGCQPLTLGRLTLRADAVPVIAAAALFAIWE